jgi:hypothetical protein
MRSVFEWSVIAMRSRPSSAADAAISSIVELPSVSSVCI